MTDEVQADNPPAQLGEGDIPITLEGVSLVLKPSVGAAQFVSRQSGGIMACIEKIVRMDFDAIVMVIGLGLGYGPGRPQPADLADKVWRTGIDDLSGGLAERAVSYLRVLSNGGRALKDQAPNPPRS